MTKIGRSRAPRWSWAVVSSVFVMGMPILASANEPHYRLDFSAPKHLPNCNDPEGFRGVMDLALTRGKLLEPPHARVLEVHVDKPNGDEHVVNITLKELDGRVRKERKQTYDRSMECFKVLHFAALLAALDLETDAPPAEEPLPPAAAMAKAPAAPPQCPVCDTPRSRPPKRPPERRWFVGLGGSTVLFAAPTTVVGAQLMAGRSWARSWSAEVNVRGSFPADALPGSVTPVRVHSLGSVAVAPCYRFASFGACALVVGSNLWVESSGIEVPRVNTAQSFGAGLRGFLEHRISARWSVRLDADLVARIAYAGARGEDPLTPWIPPHVNGAANATLFLSF